MTASLAQPTATPLTAPISAGSRGLRLGTLYGPAVFGVTAAGVALPATAVALDVSPAAAVWVLTAHALALGIGTALAGRLSDTWGLRTTLLAGAILLLVGAGVCVAAPDLGTLVVGRLILAAGSGAITSSALILAALTEPAHRPTVLARLGATMAVFSAAATLAGGVVTAAMSWRVTVALPALSLFAIPACLRMARSARASGKRADVGGAALLATSAAALLVLIQGPALGISATAVGLVAAVLVGAAGILIVRIRRHPNGFVPHLLATNRAFGKAAAIGAGVYGGLFGVMYSVPQILVNTFGWAVLGVGVALLPGAFAGAVVSRVAGSLAGTDGGMRLLAAVAGAFGVVLLGAGIGGGSPVVLIAAASFGFAALAVTQITLTAQMSSRIPAAARGGTLGLLNLAFFVGGAVGTAVAGAVSQSVGTTYALAYIAVLPITAAALASLRTPSSS
ncbi:MFS transporter (plasmid) [Micromonospora zamorensis]|uniref:MFS transporter n=1 Tax=Micromonospora zamorensis TaxID=709883 RepID=UPI002E222DFB